VGGPATETLITFFNDTTTEGKLEVCKAAANVPSGSTWSFTASAPGFSSTFTVTAGTCHIPIVVPAGAVDVTEAAVAGFAPQSAAVFPSDRLVAQDLAARTVTVDVHAGFTTGETQVAFTNALTTGYLEVCKAAPSFPSGDVFPMTVTAPGYSNSITIRGGRCTGPMQVPAGTVQVSEAAVPGYALTAAAAAPAGRLVSSDLAALSATVTVPPAPSASNETLLTMTNAVADADGDGITDGVDTAPATASTAFGDGTTTGSVVDGAGLPLFVADAPSPAGVRVTTGGGTGPATFSVCGLSVQVAPSSTVTLTCGSLTLSVATGSATIVLGGGITTVTVSEGGTAKVTAGTGGSFSVANLGPTPVTVVVDGVTTTVAPGQPPLSVQTWDFVGFAQPIDGEPVLNVVKAGRTVPVKWRLLNPDGTPVSTLASATVTARALACSAGISTDQIEETASGSSGLQNLGGGLYQLNWSTPASYAGSCKVMSLDIGDGVRHEAYFQFTR
jgi:hypothetical protein